LATTAKPLPASPARAASIVAFSARRLVCSAIELMTLTTSPIQRPLSPRRETVSTVVSASSTAPCATRAASTEFFARRLDRVLRDLADGRVELLRGGGDLLQVAGDRLRGGRDDVGLRRRLLSVRGHLLADGRELIRRGAEELAVLGDEEDPVALRVDERVEPVGEVPHLVVGLRLQPLRQVPLALRDLLEARADTLQRLGDPAPQVEPDQERHEAGHGQNENGDPGVPLEARGQDPEVGLEVDRADVAALVKDRPEDPDVVVAVDRRRPAQRRWLEVDRALLVVVACDHVAVMAVDRRRDQVRIGRQGLEQVLRGGRVVHAERGVAADDLAEDGEVLLQLRTKAGLFTQNVDRAREHEADRHGQEPDDQHLRADGQILGMNHRLYEWSDSNRRPTAEACTLAILQKEVTGSDPSLSRRRRA
jgi:hypothetical protein